MSRQDTTEAIFQNMETLSRAALSRKIEKPRMDLPTHAQIGIMLVLKHQGPLSVKDLAQKFQMTSSGATQLIDGLAKDGLIKRSEDGHDRRKSNIKLTPKGLRILDKTKKIRQDSMAKMFNVLTDAELIHLEKIQRKLMEHLQQLWTNSKTA